ncbi:MAG: MFS transporter [Fusobacteriaceae bacterium]|jgi:OFA family oxalate/formate antiporter-like MFS transporter|nr:MFS transporter [Fusobacteriaceae bacterium]
MTNTKYKWYILLILSGLNMCTGAIYVWSIFNIPIMNKTGWSLTNVSLAYSILVLLILVGSIISGKLLNKKNVKKLMWLGVILWSLGWLLSGYSSSRIMFYFTFSVLTGLGNGFIYNLIIASIPRWFEEKKGFALGIVTGTGGLAPILFSPLGHYLIKKVSVFRAFSVLGIGFVILTFTCSFFFKWPDTEKNTENNCENKKYIKREIEPNVSINVLNSKKFYLLWVIFFSTTCSGLIMSGHASNIGQAVMGFSEKQGAYLVMVLAIMSFLGRIIMGILSDKIHTLYIVCGIILAMLLSMVCLGFYKNITLFLLSFSIICFSFGSTMCIFPKIIAEQFGDIDLGKNWSIFFSGYTLSALTGPIFTSICVEKFHNYNYAFLISAIILLFGFLSYIILIINYKNKSIL